MLWFLFFNIEKKVVRSQGVELRELICIKQRGDRNRKRRIVSLDKSSMSRKISAGKCSKSSTLSSVNSKIETFNRNTRNHETRIYNFHNITIKCSILLFDMPWWPLAFKTTVANHCRRWRRSAVRTKRFNNGNDSSENSERRCETHSILYSLVIIGN